MKISGIYTIENKVDGKLYVGYTNHITTRWSNHKKDLRKGIHINPHLQRAWNRDGEENFLFEILVECEPEHMASEENHWCNLLQVHNDQYGYNITPTSPHGKIKLSEETKRKIGETNKKIRSLNPYVVSEERKRQLSEYGKRNWKSSRYDSFRTSKPDRRRKAYKYNKEGQLVREYSSATEAGIIENYSRAVICRAMSVVPARLTCKGHYWSYTEVEKLEIVPKLSKK